MFHARIFPSFVAVLLIMVPLPQLSMDAAHMVTAPTETNRPAVEELSVQPPLTAPPALRPVPAKAETRFRADRVVIKKGQRLLRLMRGNQVIKTYRIALGRNPQGHKVRQGDCKTPEGNYVIDWRNPHSKFYLSLHISYPNRKDMEEARRLGVAPGGAIMIHGLPRRLAWIKEMHRVVDWTQGCIAVTNEEIEEIWRCVPDGTPVRIES